MYECFPVFLFVLICFYLCTNIVLSDLCEIIRTYAFVLTNK